MANQLLISSMPWGQQFEINNWKQSVVHNKPTIFSTKIFWILFLEFLFKLVIFFFFWVLDPTFMNYILIRMTFMLTEKCFNVRKTYYHIIRISKTQMAHMILSNKQPICLWKTSLVIMSGLLFNIQCNNTRNLKLLYQYISYFQNIYSWRFNYHSQSPLKQLLWAQRLKCSSESVLVIF